MDRNTIYGIVLIFAIFVGFSVYNNQRAAKSFENHKATADSLYQEGELDAAREEYVTALQFKPKENEVISRVMEIDRELNRDLQSGGGEQADSLSTPAERTVNTQTPAPTRQSGRSTETVADFTGAFSQAIEGEEEFVSLENDKMIVRFSTKGGSLQSVELKEYKTHDYKPLMLFEGDSNLIGLNFYTKENVAIRTDQLFFEHRGRKPSYDASTTAQDVTFRLNSGEEGYIEMVYHLEPGTYMLDYDIRFVGMNEIIAGNQSRAVSFNWEMYMPQKEKGRTNEDNYSGLKYKHYQDEVDGTRERSQKEFEEKEVPTKLRWMAFKDQFFSTVLIADEFFLDGYGQTTKLTSETYHRFFAAQMGLPFEGSSDETIGLQYYLGPNHFQTLKKFNMDLEELVFLGRNIIRAISQYVIIPIFNWLDNYIGNYGIIILIMTIIIKMALFPLTWRSYKSQAKMKVLKPMVDEIGKKYKKPDEAMKKQQATMALYKKAGASPLGGCLPMILQMPILFSMFRFFPASIELRQEKFLWADDLSTYDSVLDLPFNIPMYGDHVSLFTLLMTVSTILTMRINSPNQAGSDQVPGMKMMMYFMPVMFMLILNNFSAGLTYYYFLANLITFGQNMLTKRFINEEEILRRVNENQKKPVKKSKFQQRMEEAAKRSQQQRSGRKR